MKEPIELIGVLVHEKNIETLVIESYEKNICIDQICIREDINLNTKR